MQLSININSYLREAAIFPRASKTPAPACSDSYLLPDGSGSVIWHVPQDARRSRAALRSIKSRTPSAARKGVFISASPRADMPPRCLISATWTIRCCARLWLDESETVPDVCAGAANGTDRTHLVPRLCRRSYFLPLQYFRSAQTTPSALNALARRLKGADRQFLGLVDSRTRSI